MKKKKDNLKSVQIPEAVLKAMYGITEPKEEPVGRFAVQCMVEINSEYGVEDFQCPEDGYFEFKTIKEAYNFKYPKKYEDGYKRITEHYHDKDTFGNAGDYTYWNHDLGHAYIGDLDGTEKDLSEYHYDQY